MWAAATHVDVWGGRGCSGRARHRRAMWPEHILTHPSTSQHIPTHPNTSQHIPTHPNTSQHIPTHPNTSSVKAFLNCSILWRPMTVAAAHSRLYLFNQLYGRKRQRSALQQAPFVNSRCQFEAATRACLFAVGDDSFKLHRSHSG